MHLDNCIRKKNRLKIETKRRKTVLFFRESEGMRRRKDLAISYTVTGTKNASLEVELHLKCQDIDVKKENL